MLTDAPPRKRTLRLFVESDQLKTLPLPADGRFSRIAGCIEPAMKTAAMQDVRGGCGEFLRTVSDFYQCPRCSVSVLAPSPLRAPESSTTQRSLTSSPH